MTKTIQQYAELKAKHPDAIILFRSRGYYHAFDKDAKDVSQILGITLMKNLSIQDEVGNPMCEARFPFTALDTYLPRLIRAGKRVAICDKIDEQQNKK